jgi:hypothetical protein
MAHLKELLEKARMEREEEDHRIQYEQQRDYEWANRPRTDMVTIKGSKPLWNPEEVALCIINSIKTNGAGSQDLIRELMRPVIQETIEQFEMSRTPTAVDTGIWATLVTLAERLWSKIRQYKE